MLSICSRAMKSGSAWFNNILINLMTSEYPPALNLMGRSNNKSFIIQTFLRNILRRRNAMGLIGTSPRFIFPAPSTGVQRPPVAC